MESLRVILAHPADPNFPIQGGAIKYTLDLFDYLLKHNIKVVLIGARYLRSNPLKPFFIPIDGYASACSWQIYLLGLIIKLPFMRLPKNAIIHACRLDYMFPFIIYYPTNPKIITLDRQSTTFQIKHQKLFYILKPLLNAVIKICLRHIDRVITNKDTLEFYENIYPQVKNKTIVLPTSFVDLDRFRPMDKDLIRKKYGYSLQEKIIIFVGRIAKEKNLEFLLRSFAFTQKIHPDTRLVIVGRGDPDYQQSLENLINHLGLSNNVVFMGERRHKEMPQILNCADALALCSLFEGSPTVVREALACGVPVVSTDVGDVRFIVDESMGRIVNRDEREFARAIIDVSNMKQAEVAIRSRNKIKELGLDKMAVLSKIVGIYRELDRLQRGG